MTHNPTTDPIYSAAFAAIGPAVQALKDKGIPDDELWGAVFSAAHNLRAELEAERDAINDTLDGMDAERRGPDGEPLH